MQASNVRAAKYVAVRPSSGTTANILPAWATPGRAVEDRQPCGCKVPAAKPRRAGPEWAICVSVLS
ncbi:hypothetical protein Murka_0030 [Xanthomonas phage Murka]|nr:hypothetical protein Murka_0030 [Xanthomonas phage Murka]